MVARREPVDRVVDVLVAAPVCTFRAARRAAPLLAEAIRRSVSVGPPADHLTSSGPAEAEPAPVAADVDATVEVDEGPVADTLAIADYDHLAARQVVDRLGGLDADELDAIDAYERATRHRQTILRRIDQLRS